MALLKVNWKPSPKELTSFSLIALFALPALAALFHFVYGWSLTICLSVAAFGPVIALSRLLSVTLTRWIYCGMMAACLPIGLTVSFTCMALFYYLLMTPLALVFRLMGRDPLQRRFDAEASTYWLPHQQSTEKERYFQQF